MIITTTTTTTTATTSPSTTASVIPPTTASSASGDGDAGAGGRLSNRRRAWEELQLGGPSARGPRCRRNHVLCFSQRRTTRALYDASPGFSEKLLLIKKVSRVIAVVGA